jgi:CheY-like chemotaxis protein
MPRVALVVDDSMLIRHAVCRYFEERGFAVESASNGAEALEILKSVLPDIIVTDLSMPKMDGGEFISRLKSKEQTKDIPVVVLSGRSSGTDPTAKELRANFVVYKDVEIVTQLQRALAAALGEN